MSNLGIGVMIDMLAGRGTTGEAIRSSIGKTIASVAVANDQLEVVFDDGSKLSLWDGGQSCCENRYMVCDDDLSSFVDGKLVGVETREAPDVEDGGEDHEVEFLVLHTDKGDIVVSNHNEHNGYYGGFSVNASFTPAE